MTGDSAETIQALIAAVKPVVSQAAGRGEQVGHLLLVLGAGRFNGEAGPVETAKALREMAGMVEKGMISDPFQGL